DLAFVAAAESCYGGKTGPGMLRGFCRATGLVAAEVAMVGDTVADLAMARAGGAGLAVGVLTGASKGDGLAALADHVIDSVDGVEDLLDRLGRAP
ncbi:MAG: HAD family hydrolase, partial [Alphaproteobacteria bacterium]